jgi:hypothetical protein
MNEYVKHFKTNLKYCFVNVLKLYNFRRFDVVI